MKDEVMESEKQAMRLPRAGAFSFFGIP